MAKNRIRVLFLSIIGGFLVSTNILAANSSQQLGEALVSINNQTNYPLSRLSLTPDCSSFQECPALTIPQNISVFVYNMEQPNTSAHVIYGELAEPGNHCEIIVTPDTFENCDQTHAIPNGNIYCQVMGSRFQDGICRLQITISGGPSGQKK